MGDFQIPQFDNQGRIIKAKVGDTIRNDGEKIKVTRLLERRAILAKNLKNIKRK